MGRIKNTVMKNGKRYVCRIFDNGGETLDRYTIALKGERDTMGRMYYPYLASSDHPFNSLGQHGENSTFIHGRCFGKRVSFDSVTADVQSFILQNLGNK